MKLIKLNPSGLCTVTSIHWFYFVFETKSYVSEAGLELTVYLKIILNFWFLYLYHWVLRLHIYNPTHRFMWYWWLNTKLHVFIEYMKISIAIRAISLGSHKLLNLYYSMTPWPAPSPCSFIFCSIFQFYSSKVLSMCTWLLICITLVLRMYG